MNDHRLKVAIQFGFRERQPGLILYVRISMIMAQISIWAPNSATRFVGSLK